MNLKKLSRRGKEDLFTEKWVELQIKWGKLGDDVDPFRDWSDEQLEWEIRETISQLRSGKFRSILKSTVKVSVVVVVLLGVAGLLSLGILQLFYQR